MMDEYSASYYIISSHTQKHFAGSSRIWYERLKVITLPRELVIMDDVMSSAPCHFKCPLSCRAPLVISSVVEKSFEISPCAPLSRDDKRGGAR